MNAVWSLRSSHSTRYGWNVDGSENLIQQGVIKQIVQWASEGQSCQAIATKLNERNEPSKHGVKWQHGSVRSVLKMYKIRPRPGASPSLR